MPESLPGREGSERPHDPAQVSYGLEGIEWTGPVEPWTTVTAVVTYTVQGRDAFVYDVVGRGRSGTVEVDLRLLETSC